MSINAQPIEIVLKGSTERIDVQVVDVDGNPIAATALRLRIYDASESLLVDDDFFLGLAVPSVGATRIVNSGTGAYYYPFGQYAGETATEGRYYFNWTITGAALSEPVNIVQVARVVSLRTMALLPDFRLQIDKAAISVNDDPLDPCFLGYTDSMLLSYLDGGLGLINAYQPYPVWSTVDQFPTDVHGRILLDAALLVGLDSQEMFAIVTDLPNYSDNGQTFALSHQPALAAMAQRIAQRLDALVPAMKKHYVSLGTLRLEMGPNWRLANLISAAPSGSLFRSMFMA